MCDPLPQRGGYRGHGWWLSVNRISLILPFMTRSFQISIDDLSRQAWDRALAETPAPYQQDWAYGEVMAGKGARVIRAAIRSDAGELCGLAQFLVRPFALVARFGLCSYGPVWLTELSSDEQNAALRALRRAIRLSWPRLVAFTLPDDLQPSGFSKIMTGDATVMLDLTQSEEALRAELDGKWRNRLVAAEKSELTFSGSGLKPGQYEWLLEKESEQRRARGYRGLPPDVTAEWQALKAKHAGGDRKAGLRIWRADLGREAAGAMMFLIHGAGATYHIGWSSDAGRKAGAHNLILWNAMLELKQLGIKRLDLGGVNTASGAGIARFKLGTGGQVIQRSGTFV
tara:strand:- start:2207 stop:3232 length:1026 start_codon:yes stop_codon:yes gene_type:complete